MRQMSIIFVFIACVWALGGCRNSKIVGADLHTDDIAQETVQIETYFGQLCVRARVATPYKPNYLVLAGETIPENTPWCALPPMSPNWILVVEAGINDINRRCDHYLEWLHKVSRRIRAKKRFLNASSVLTFGLMGNYAASRESLATVALAFGFAQDVLDIRRSRVLLDLDLATVRDVVQEAQILYIKDVAKNAQVKRATQAEAVLREYLNLCLPGTIEHQVNKAVQTSFRLAGAGKSTTGLGDFLGRKAPPITRGRAEQPLPGGGTEGPDERDLEFIRGTDLTGFEKGILLNDGQIIQENLCVSPANGFFGPETRKAILLAQIIRRDLPKNKGRITTTKQRDILLGLKECDLNQKEGPRNRFEHLHFDTVDKIQGFQKKLQDCDRRVRKKLNPNDDKTDVTLSGVFDDDMRTAIKRVQENLKFKDKLPGGPSNQVTGRDAQSLMQVCRL